MRTRILTRAAFGAAATVAALLPLTACSSNNETGPAASTDPSSTPPVRSTTAPASPGSTAAEYQDGTYTVRGVYGGAPSYITVTLTLTDDTISDVQVGLMPDNNDTSRGYQERFAAAVPDEVNGKSIDDLQVGIIAGASGCADGFNDALDKIRQQASEN